MARNPLATADGAQACRLRSLTARAAPTRGIVNNNPGNIRKSDAAWHGAVAGSDPVFVTFDTPENGIRAMAKVLLTYQRQHGLDTIAELIERWAPAAENDSFAYIDDVATRLGIDPDERIDLANPQILAALCGAIIRHENGRQPYAAAILAAGVGAALG
jgi:hypothetical protein